MQLNKIMDDQGFLYTIGPEIGQQAVEYYMSQFKGNSCLQEWSMLECLPSVITEDENDEIIRLPEMEEVRREVFELSRNSALGLDGFSGLFFEECWETLAEDVAMVVKAFFCG